MLLSEKQFTNQIEAVLSSLKGLVNLIWVFNYHEERFSRAFFFNYMQLARRKKNLEYWVTLNFKISFFVFFAHLITIVIIVYSEYSKCMCPPYALSS